ncbi:hypothetical protein AB1E18_000940 [Capra hircus]
MLRSSSDAGRPRGDPHSQRGSAAPSSQNRAAALKNQLLETPFLVPPCVGRLTSGEPSAPKQSSPLALSARPTSLNYTSRGAPGSPGAGSTWAGGGGGKGSARAAAPSQCGARRGGHVPLFGAFVRARVCWCSECGQAARTEQGSPCQ